MFMGISGKSFQVRESLPFPQGIIHIVSRLIAYSVIVIQLHIIYAPVVGSKGGNKTGLLFFLLFFFEKLLLEPDFFLRLRLKTADNADFILRHIDFGEFYTVIFFGFIFHYTKIVNGKKRSFRKSLNNIVKGQFRA